MPTVQDVHDQIKDLPGTRLLQKRAEHEILASMLSPQERIYSVAQSKYGGHTGILYLTDDRLIFLAKTPRSTSTEIINLSTLLGVQHKPGFAFGQLTVRTKNGMYIFESIVDSDKGATLSQYLHSRLTGVPFQQIKSTKPETLPPRKLKMYGILFALVVGFWLYVARPWQDPEPPFTFTAAEPTTSSLQVALSVENTPTSKPTETARPEPTATPRPTRVPPTATPRSTATPKPTRVPPTPTPDRSFTLASDVNLRSGPNTAFNLRTTLSAQSVIRFLSKKTFEGEEWYEIQWENSRGWVSGGIVSPSEDVASSLPTNKNQFVLPTPVPEPTAVPPTDVPPAASNCDPSYPDFCLQPGIPDLNCGDIPYRRFRVYQPDPHGFDRDKDGIGCES